jgi:hypothetical protein
VAAAWPFAARAANASWTVHRVLKAQANRRQLLRDLIKAGDATYTGAVRILGGSTFGRDTRIDSVVDRAAAAKQQLADPAVRRELVRDDHVRNEWWKTVRAEDARNAARVARKERESAPRLVEASEFYDAIGRAQHARQDIRQFIGLLSGLPPLDTEQRAMVRHELDRLAQAVDYAQTFGRGRQAASLTDEIQEFLAEEVN